jgi:hypothetical protein
VPELQVEVASHVETTAFQQAPLTLLLLLLLSCRHYLQRWARHARSRHQQRQQLAAALQLHKQHLAGSTLTAWHAAAAAEADLKQRLALWQQRKQLTSLRAWRCVADARQQQRQLVQKVRTLDDD